MRGSAFERVARRLSLRSRLVIMMLTLVTFALTIAGIATVATLRAQLVAQVDNDLREVSLEITRRPPDGIGGDARRGRSLDSLPNPYDMRFVAADGTEIWHPTTALLDDRVPNVDALPFAPFGERDRGPRPGDGYSGTVPDGENPLNTWRVLALPAQLPTPGGAYEGYFIVATPLDSVDRTVSSMIGKLVLLAFAVLAACALAGLVGLRRAFNPLREIEDATAAFGRGDFSRRITPRPESTEVGRLGSAINSMMDDVGEAFTVRQASENRMRRFVADASHELRTPLVSVRGYAELYRAGAINDPADVARAFGRVEDEAIRMTGLVEDLLLLARLDEQRPAHRVPLDLTEICVDVVTDARAVAVDRDITLRGLDGECPGKVPLVGDDARLRQVVTNLVHNALRHTPDGSPVEVECGAVPGGTELRIIDHGPGISGEDAERVFERFYRTDTSRQRGAGGGSGLGLAITAAIVAGHGGTVGIEETPGGGATFVVRLPERKSSATPELSANSQEEPNEPQA